MSPSQGHIVLLAPMTGPVVPLANVPDPVFSGGMFGDGIGVDPLVGQLVAPCDGVVTHLARTGHAVTLATAEGVEILLHIGIDTVELNGRGFTPKVAQGAHVHAGDLLIEFDQDLVARNAPSLVSVIAIANSDAFEIVERAEGGMLKAGQTPLLSLRPRAGAAAEASRHATNVTEEARQSVTLAHAGGLHARPAARAREAARGLDARVEVRFEGRKAPIESVVGLLGLGAGEGATVEILGVGPQAEAAVEAVAHELLREAHGEVEEKPARESSPTPQMAVQTSGAPLAPNTLAGVCASPGVALGKLVRWDDADLDPPETASGTSAAESRLLDKALATVDAELNKTVRDASQRGAHGEAGIFAVHRVLLEDPTLLDAARDLISLGKSAGFAWREAIRAQIAILTKIDDALLAERAADLRDLEKRVLRALGYSNDAARTLPDEAVLVAEEFTPSDLSTLDRTRVTALVMARGGATSHAAILARQSGIPALVAVGDALHAIPEGTLVVVDATAGRIEFAPTALDIERARLERTRLAGVREANRRTSQQAAATADGRAIEVAANIATLEDAKTAVENGAEGCGLLRTEFLFMDRDAPPSEDEQFAAYQAIAAALAGRPLIIRTLDVGADKPVAYLPLPHDENPALGLRGVRVSLRWPQLLRRPVARHPARAARAPARSCCRWSSSSAELRAVRRAGRARRPSSGRTTLPKLGVMVETPAAGRHRRPIAARGRGLPLHRHQRPGPVRAGHGPHQSAAGRPGRRPASGGAAADRGEAAAGGAQARPVGLGLRRPGLGPGGRADPHRPRRHRAVGLAGDRARAEGARSAR